MCGVHAQMHCLRSHTHDPSPTILNTTVSHPTPQSRTPHHSSHISCVHLSMSHPTPLHATNSSYTLHPTLSTPHSPPSLRRNRQNVRVADQPLVFNAVQLDTLGSQGSFVSTVTQTTTEGGGGEWEGKGKGDVMLAKLQSSFDAKKGQHRVQGYCSEPSESQSIPPPSFCAFQFLIPRPYQHTSAIYQEPITRVMGSCIYLSPVLSVI